MFTHNSLRPAYCPTLYPLSFLPPSSLPPSSLPPSSLPPSSLLVLKVVVGHTDLNMVGVGRFSRMKALRWFSITQCNPLPNTHYLSSTEELIACTVY